MTPFTQVRRMKSNRVRKLVKMANDNNDPVLNWLVTNSESMVSV